MKKIIIGLIVFAVIGLGFYFIRTWQANKLNNLPYLAHGNGRIEATEIDIAARLSGKVEKVCVLEGEKVKAGQVLVLMQTNVLVANLARAEATKEQAKAAEGAANAKIQVQEANLVKAKADLLRLQSVLENAEINYNRYKKLIETNATAQQEYDKMKTAYDSAKANVASGNAAIKEVEANLGVAKADAIGARANILAAEAEITRIKADIDDSVLKAPLDGRVQYRVAEPGEVLSEGGRAINMVDLTDVYMTFFLPEQLAGKVKIGSDVRIVLDMDPQHPLPAKVTYVADVAQFTPKTVETQVERQKLMFRIKAHLKREMLERYIDNVKTGLPGVAWVKLDDNQPWPKELDIDPVERERIQKLYEETQKNAVPLKSVLSSQTQEAAHSLPLDRKTLEKAKIDAQDMTKEKAVDMEIKLIKQIDGKKKGNIEQDVKAAKDFNKKDQTVIDKNVEVIKQVNEAAQKAKINGDKK